jgi:hypothetical protein
MRLTIGRPGRGGERAAWWCLAAFLADLILGYALSPAYSLELSAPQAALYSTVSIFPPSAQRMTVCYGFVCRRREMLDFTPGDRNALTQILAAGHASAAAERAAVQKAVIWFDRRMGPVIGTSKRVAKADIRALDDKHNYDCWDTTRNTTSLLLVTGCHDRRKMGDGGLSDRRRTCAFCAHSKRAQERCTLLPTAL